MKNGWKSAGHFFFPGENVKWGQPGEIRWKVVTLDKIPKKFDLKFGSHFPFSPGKKKTFFFPFFFQKMKVELKKCREEKEREMHMPLPHFPLSIQECQNPQ